MVVIAISGMPGCGSTTLGRLLAAKLGLKFYSAGKYFKSFSDEAKETQKAISHLKTDKGSSKEFHKEIDDLTRKMATEGNVVMEGKLAVHFLKAADYKIWLKAPFDVRTERISKRDKTSIEEAASNLKEKEDAERRLWKDVYGFDYFQQENEADFVVDTSEKTPEEIVEVLVNEMEKDNHRE